MFISKLKFPSSLISPSSVFTSQLCKLYIRQIDRLPCQLFEMSQVLLVCARVKVRFKLNTDKLFPVQQINMKTSFLSQTLTIHQSAQRGSNRWSHNEQNTLLSGGELCKTWPDTLSEHIYIFFITVMITSQKTFRPTLASNISGNVLASCQSKIWTFSRMKMIFVWQQ